MRPSSLADRAVLPAIVLGDVLTNVFYALPAPAMLAAFRARDASRIGVTPYFYLAALMNCVCWMVYAHLLRDPFVFGSNLLGTAASALYYQVCVYVAGAGSAGGESAGRLMATGAAATGALLAASAGVTLGVRDAEARARALVAFYGVGGDVCDVVMLVLPLANIVQGRPIVGWIAWLTLLNSAIWCAYAAVTRQPWLGAPNVLTGLSGAAQVALWVRQRAGRRAGAAQALHEVVADRV